MYDSLMGLEPKRVLELFSALCQIPHGSKNEKAISDYIRDFCLDLGLDTYQDHVYNLIIKKPATKGYESAPTVILQAHIDMVCEKNADTVHDFLKDPIRVLRDGDRIYADGTTLGADDATGVAFAMCVLESADLPHPALEVILTADEEAGMSGIKELDFSRVSGKVIINLDCSDEGIVLGCAGTAVAHYTMQLTSDNPQEGDIRAALHIRGLKGGHSGLDITKERGNANVILARILSEAQPVLDMRIASFNGGMQTNAIPREADAVILFNKKHLPRLEEILAKWRSVLENELRVSDPGIAVTMDVMDSAGPAFTRQDTCRLLDALMLTPNGVQAMHIEVPGLPETSGNLAAVTTTADSGDIKTLYRSCLDSKKRAVLEKCRRVAALTGARMELDSDSPEWEYKADSRLAALIKHTYQKRFGQELVVDVSHGGNECGTFYRRIPGADIVCTGTQIIGAHTPDESVMVSVIQKEWEMLCLTLAGMTGY